MNKKDFEKQGEDVHFRIQEELFKKDKKLQKQLYQQFTTIPAEFRDRMKLIEAGNLGYKIEDGYPINSTTGEPASDIQLETIEKATDRAMLRVNPHLEKYNMKYQDGFFIPIDYKKLMEKEG